jgi:hypothetical protein
MEIYELLRAHRFESVVATCRDRLKQDPTDIEAVGNLAAALKALGRYEEAIPLYERIGTYEKKTSAAVGLPGRQLDIACIYWMMGECALGIEQMGALVDGILDGSINYGDIAGAVTQGLLLYYMGVTAGDDGASAKALKYMRNRAKRSAIRLFPGPVVLFYLDQIHFPELLEAATEKRRAVRDVTSAIDVATDDLLSRRQVCVALFHDGVKARARGDESHCLIRMHECAGLRNPLIEQEWYLARYEVGKASKDP